MMDFNSAEQFLKDHYSEDVLDADRIRRDAEHWNLVLGDAARFPNADLDFICAFDDAACTFLGGLSHQFAVEA
jgi:hypothetical protein